MHVDIGGAGVAVLLCVEALEDGDASEDSPDEECKGDSSLPSPARIHGAAAARGSEGGGHGDRAGEPEYDGDGEEAEADELVEELGCEAGGGEEVGDDEEGPDGIEDAEGDRARRPPHVGDVCEQAELENVDCGQHEECEGNKAESHGCGYVCESKDLDRQGGGYATMLDVEKFERGWFTWRGKKEWIWEVLRLGRK